MVDVVGTPFTLHYQSDRVSGRAAANPVVIAHSRQLGGWTLNAHHVYDVAKKALYLGSGERREGPDLGEVTLESDGTIRIRSIAMGVTYEFDSSGRHFSTLDVRTGAKLLRYGYDTEGRLRTVTDIQHQVIRIERDGTGNPTAIVNPRGVRTTFALDANKYLASITNPAGEKKTFTMTPEGLLVGMVDPKGRQFIYTYDPAGRLIKDELVGGGSQSLTRVTQPNGSYFVTHTSAENRATTYIVTKRANGGEDRSVSSPSGYMISSSSKSDGSQTVLESDGTQREIIVTPDPNMSMTQTVTTPGGLKKVASYTRPHLSSRIYETYQVNGYKLIRDYEDEYGTKSLTEHVEAQFRPPFTNTMFPHRKLIFNEKGRVIIEEVRGLAPIYYEYNDRGQLASVKQRVPVEGNADNNSVAPNSDDMRSLEMQYDDTGYISQLKDSLGRAINVKRDGAGRFIEAHDVTGQQIVDVKRDANGNITRVTPPASGEHVIEYQLADLPSTYIPPIGKPTKYEYNNDRQLRRVVLPDDRRIELTYDAAGRIADLKADQISKEFRYNATTDKVDSITTKDGVELSYKYDGPLLKSESWTGPSVQGAVQREYDEHFRIKSLQLVPAATQPSAQGRPPHHLVPDLTPPATPTLRLEEDHPPDPILLPIVFSYSADGWLENVGGFRLTREPWNGLLRSTVLGDGKVSYSYSNPKMIFGGIRDNPPIVEGGWIPEVTSKVPYSIPNNFVHDEWAYNPFGEVTNYVAKYRDGAQGDTLLFSESIQRDAIGRVTEKSETILDPLQPGKATTKTYTYQYDTAGRLLEVMNKTANIRISRYSYDANGNRLTYKGPTSTSGPGVVVPFVPDGGISAKYDAADRLLQYGRFTYSWSPNGYLMAKRLDAAKALDRETTRYVYDVLGNLQSVTLPDGKQVAYEIDGRNRRIAKRVNGQVNRRWVYQDGLRPLAELDPDNNVVSRFVYATGRNVPDYFIKSSATYRIITDQLGSPRLVVDVATGKIAQQLEYDEFGKIISDTNPGYQPFGFVGGLYDSDTGLVRFGARDYDPNVGRWTNRDPIGFSSGDINLYAYVGNDPVNLKDPLGLSWGRKMRAVVLAMSLFMHEGKSAFVNALRRMETTEEIIRKSTQAQLKRKRIPGGFGPPPDQTTILCIGILPALGEINFESIFNALADINGDGVIDGYDTLEWLNPLPIPWILNDENGKPLFQLQEDPIQTASAEMLEEIIVEKEEHKHQETYIASQNLPNFR